MLKVTLTRAGALALGAAAALAASACGSSSSGPSGASASGGTPTVVSLARAADVTSKAGGAHIALTGQFEAAGANVSLTGEGHFNFAPPGEGEFTLTLSGIPGAAALGGGGSFQLHELLKDRTMYLGSPLLAGRLPGGAKWIKAALPSGGGSDLGLSASSITSGGLDPSQYLQELRAAGANPRAVGHDTIRGVATTRYAATVDLAKLVEAHAGGAASGKVKAALGALRAKLGLTQLPIETWIDGQGLVRRVALDLHAAAAGATVGGRIQVDFFDFGTTPPVSVPAPSEVLSANASALQGLATSG